jgi:hypothetical protein
MQASPRVAIIYLCYKNLRHLPEVVSSIAALTFPKDQLTFILNPNGSPDGIADEIRKTVIPRSGTDLPKVKLIDDGKNRGFTGGNNVAIEWAIKEGFDYVYLLNGDAKLDPDAITEALKLAESDEKIASVQSTVLFWGNRERVNVTGGMIHAVMYGYARDNGEHISNINCKDGEEILYSSCAAVLFKTGVLKKVGLLEEGFFMYHDDLELGLRIHFAGYKNVLSRKSIAEHDYQFGRNTKMFEWMEIYRWTVWMAYAKWKSIILTAPLWIAIDLFGIVAAFAGGWGGVKIRGLIKRVSTKNLVLAWRMRKRAQSLRVISDRHWLNFVTGKIEGQPASSIFIKASNIVTDVIWRGLRLLIIW